MNVLAKRAPAEYASLVLQGFTRQHLAELFAASGYCTGAEIGVADGRYSLVLCQAIPGLSLLCVDPWAKYPGNPRGGPQEQHDQNFALAQTRLTPYDVTFARALSVTAARNISDGSLDFVYIDGNHERAYVAADLEAWSPKVRTGGIVAGHDFYHFVKRPAGVVEAVADFTERHGITDWHLCDEREPSFWWVKS